MEGKCPVCLQQATHKCSNCHLVYYCTKEHQKSHWKTHKSLCKPIIVNEDKVLGRHLTASRNIKEGQVLFKEKPLMIGPPQITAPVCLGCCQLVTAKTSRPCARCGWPVCGDACQESPHHQPECALTVARGSKVQIQTFGTPHPNYQSITVVRCLHLKKSNPEVWNRLVALESHCDYRKKSDKWKNEHIQIAQFISRFYKLGEEFSDDEIMKISGIVQVNGHEVPLTDPPFVAIYDTTSMLEHNCRANCSKSFSNRGEVLIVAAIDIRQGENISICYTDPLWGTANRKHHLYETKFFECSCERCNDVTDLGTMLSALRCQKEKCHGYVLPKSFKIRTLEDETNQTDEENKLETNLGKIDLNGKKSENNDNGKELNGTSSDKEVSKISNGHANKIENADHESGTTKPTDTSDWFCNVCEGSVTEKYVLKLMDHIGKDLDAMEKGNCESCLRFLHHYGKYLHPNHYYMIDITLAMTQLIGQEAGSCLQAVTDERLELKIDTCRQMAEFLEKLVPAELRARGGVTFELHAAVAELGRRKAAHTGEGPGILLKYLLESREILEKSIKLLENEPEELPEGKIAKQARVNIKDMEAVIQNLYALDGPMI